MFERNGPWGRFASSFTYLTSAALEDIHKDILVMIKMIASGRKHKDTRSG
jgi:hypothetical protein